ncbi:ribulose-5-phosphate 4-epimerase/fuculose-1-phosphate aldolase [Bradyrhizobium sp. AZCC 1719]
MSETRIREEICRFGRSLFERGLTPGSSGNISVKLDDGGWLVTPTNASLGFLDPARMSRLGPDGRLVSGDAPTKEVPLHTALYQTRNAARAVVHLHSTHSVALSMLPEIDPRAALPPMTAYYVMKCGHTALVPYYRPGDPAVADAIKGLAGKYSSVLLANHGPVVSGDTLEAAVFAMEELEETAKLYLLLRGLNPRYLSREQVADLTKVFGLTLPEHGHERAQERNAVTRPTDAEVEAAARVLDKAGRHNHWWPKTIKSYDEFAKTDPIAKSEFEGIVEQMLMAASQAKGNTETP